jgi:uncharacterized protein (DUF488 family)
MTWQRATPTATLRLATVGHGVLEAERFAELLGDADVNYLVDVRAHPGSRRSPHFSRDQLVAWLPQRDIRYRWLAALGGRRRPVAESRHVALRNSSFRAYADHMSTIGFEEGVEDLVALMRGSTVAVMCSETLWWRCHRRLLSDHLELVRGAHVEHLFHNGRRQPHIATAGVRVDGRSLVYDSPPPTPEPHISSIC